MRCRGESSDAGQSVLWEYQIRETQLCTFHSGFPLFESNHMPKRRRIFEPRIDRTPPNLQKLVRLIFSEEFLPGDRLIERDLAARLDLSRIPVREGLQKLVSKGILLKDEVNRGLRLREYSPDEVAHLRADGRDAGCVGDRSRDGVRHAAGDPVHLLADRGHLLPDELTRCLHNSNIGRSASSCKRIS